MEELKDQIIEASIDVDEEKWKKKRNIWLAAVVISFVAGLFVKDILNLWGILLLFGGAYIYFSRQVDDHGKGRKVKKELKIKGEEEDRVIEVMMPWYHTVTGILMIGLFTAGIYWFVGPFVRMNWTGKRIREATEE